MKRWNKMRTTTVVITVLAAMWCGYRLTPLWDANYFQIPAVPWKKWHSLRVGMTTEEVRGLLGSPNHRTVDADGSQSWYYEPWYCTATVWLGFDTNACFYGGTHDVD